ncbi:MAG TPA: NAD(P)/FAD-dependent oxidoreductase, partial [Rudaea sp.]
MTDVPPRRSAIVIGAGPAGLSVAACLQREGIEAIVLEQAQRVGDAWHRHYERLHLHTSKGLSALPFAAFPRAAPRYPSRAEVVDYLDAYARRFAIAPRFGQRVIAARPIDGGWRVATDEAEYESPTLIIATGLCRTPYEPRWPGRDGYRGTVVHSAAYRNGAAFAGKDVLVVGIGNSGAEIALDLHEHGARASIAVRGPVNVVPRELFGIPILAFGIAQNALPARWADTLNRPLMRMVVGDLAPYGLQTPATGPVTQLREAARVPLIDVGTIDAIRRGAIAVRHGISAFTENGVRFTDGSEGSFDAVVLATGYRARVDSFLAADGVFDENGTPRHSGAQNAQRGLYFCGFKVSPTGMLRAIAR